MAEITCGIHWYTWCVRAELEQVLDTIGGSFGAPEFTGGYGHPSRLVHESGTQVYYGSKQEGQPIVVNAPGEACEVLSDDVVVPSLGFGMLGTWATRVDLAVDLEPASLARRRLVEMHRSWKRRTVLTRMAWRSHTMYQSEGADEGWTAYFGGRTSALKLRAYDRRGPLRLEFEWRPDRNISDHVPMLLHRDGAPKMWRSCAGAIEFPMPWYQQLLDGPKVEWQPTEVEDTAFADAMDAIRTQLGVSLWAAEVLGMTLKDLAVEPEEPRGEILRKLMGWVPGATAMGYNGEALKEKLRCKSRSRRVHM